MGHRIPATELKKYGISAPKRTKYGNRKTTALGKVFDSKKEATRYVVLKALEESRSIINLETQVKFEIRIYGSLICTYTADFIYVLKGELVVEDVKSAATRKNTVYRLKKKLMKATHGIDIQEV